MGGGRGREGKGLVEGGGEVGVSESQSGACWLVDGEEGKLQHDSAMARRPFLYAASTQRTGHNRAVETAWRSMRDEHW